MLENSTVLLRPLALEDVSELWPIASEPAIFQYMRTGILDSPERMEAWVRDALARCERGTDYPFVIVDKASGRLAGATRYLSIDLPNCMVEIGGSWLGGPFRGTGVNTAAKYLLLRHAFEKLDCVRVQFRTDSRNLRSQRAIEKVGAVKEGVLRKDFLFPDGYQRSTIFYSIVDDEWPAVRRRLEKLIGQ